MPTQTEAFVLESVNAPFKLQTITLDDPLPGEVLVDIKACGVCHTDLLIQNGAFPSAFPNVTGHEGSGTVVKVGSDVTRVKEGDKVLMSFAYCQSCMICSNGHPAACYEWIDRNFGRKRPDGSVDYASRDEQRIHGTFFGQSAFAKQALVVEASLVVVPNDTDLVMLASLGCGMQTGAGALYNVLKPEQPKSSSIVVFGAGAVGMAAIFAAAAMELETIISVDLVDSRMELAKSLGATHSVSGKDPRILDKIRSLTKGGATYAVEATGAAPCIKTAWEALGPMGKYVQLGTPGPGPTANIPIHEAVCMTKTYYGVCEGDSNPPEFIPKLVELYKQGKFPLDKISKAYNYEKFNDAVHAMHDGTVIKPIVVFS